MPSRFLNETSNIVLIGLRGTGKSTCGRLLAKRLGRSFLDTDEIVQERAGKTVREIFAEGGEQRFRELESAVVREVAETRAAVIATGGGAVLDPGNVAPLRRTGFVVHLSASPHELWKRIETDVTSLHQRPRLTGSHALGGERELEELLLKRSAAYSSARDVEVRVEHRSPEHIVEAILLLMRARHMLRTGREPTGALEQEGKISAEPEE